MFQLNQYWSKEFKEAYGAMTRVLPEEEIEKVPVTNETIKRIGDISPLFKEIEPELLDSAQDWASCGDGPDAEIQGGWYHWALMKAMEKNGYFESATKANDFYKKVANEINNACDKGEIKSLPKKRISNTCRFDFEDIVKILKETRNTIRYEYTLEDIEVEVKNKNILDSLSGKQMGKLLKEVSNSELSENIAYKGNLNSTKITILKGIKDIYTFANKYIFYISLCLYIILIFRFVMSKKELYEEILILTGILVLYYCRIFVLTFTSNMMWTEAINPMYMATAYLLQFVFSILSIIWGTKEIKDLFYKYKKVYKIK